MEQRQRAAACGLMPLALLAFTQCALLFPVTGLDPEFGASEGGSNLVDAGPDVTARADASLDADAREADGAEAAQEAGDDGPGDDQGLDAPEASPPLDAEAGTDGPPACTANPTGEFAYTFETVEQTAGWDVVPNADRPINVLKGEGHDCPGALAATITFAAYSAGDTPSLLFTYGGQTGGSWSSGSTRLHAWLKLEPQVDAGADGFSTLGTAGIFIRSHSSSAYTFYSINVTPMFSDGGWHELVLDLNMPDGGPAGWQGPNVDRTSIQAFGVFVSPQATKPAGGPDAPYPVQVVVDDVWLE